MKNTGRNEVSLNLIVNTLLYQVGEIYLQFIKRGKGNREADAVGKLLRKFLFRI